MMAKQPGQLSQQCESNHQCSPVEPAQSSCTGAIQTLPFVKPARFWSDQTLQTARGRAVALQPLLCRAAAGVQISQERLQPCCAARTRCEQPGAAASRCFYNTNAKAPLSKCKHTLPGQAAPASDNQARSLPGTRCRAPSTSKNERCLRASSKRATVWAGHTPKPETTETERQARQPRQWRERQRFKYFRQLFSKAEIACNSHPNSRELT